MADEIAISVKNVKKDFHLLKHKENSLKRTITQAFKKKEKGADTYHALKGISVDIKKGEFFGVLGRNGSGKSTLLKILAEIYQPSSGSVKVSGKLVPFIELGVGFNNELSGRENVFLNGALLGFSRKEIEERYDKIVEFAELEAFMDQKLKNYSSGMKVRLAFSVAIQADADILLLDEVLAVGDASFQRKCYDYFKSLKKDKKTIVFVSHNMSAIREYCDRAILIKDGKVAHEGSADAIADEYLKLFNGPAEAKSSSEKRWGSGEVQLDDFVLTRDKTNISITTTVSGGDRDVEDMKLGIHIKDSEGKTVAGLNSLNVENGQKLAVKAGEKLTLHFDMQNTLGNGTYSVTAVLKGQGTTLYNWDEAATFANLRDDVFYPTVLLATMKVTKE